MDAAIAILVIATRQPLWPIGLATGIVAY